MFQIYIYQLDSVEIHLKAFVRSTSHCLLHRRKPITQYDVKSQINGVAAKNEGT